jgi:pimeloyl-ACP methyl ester carboxylesterase
MMLSALGALTLGMPAAYAVALEQDAKSAALDNEKPIDSPVAFVERNVTHDGHRIYTREYPGKGPAFVLIHGFPDNLHIYDYVVPYLTRAGRRVVVFDFLGFGQSKKIAPEVYPYSFKQQVGDLAAVVDTLKLDKFIPVGHDSGGPCAINYAIDNPHRIAWLGLMNCFYAQSPTLRLPEIIEVFGNPWLRDLAKAFLDNPEQMSWLLRFQDEHFMQKSPEDLKKRFVNILRPIVSANFANGAGPGFAQMTAQVRDNVAYNTTRLPYTRTFKPNVKLIWGTLDPYLTPAAAAAIAKNFPRGEVKTVETGHWLMIDAPAQVAQLLLDGR